MHQRIALPAREEALGLRLQRAALGIAALVAAVVADQPEHAAQAGLVQRARHRADVARRAGAGVAHGGEAAAQRLERRELGREIDELVVEAGFERHPHAPEDLRRLAVGQRLAEGLREMVVRVDHAGHQQPAGQALRHQSRVARGQQLGGADVGEVAVGDVHGVAGGRAVAQHQVVGHEQQLGAAKGAAS